MLLGLVAPNEVNVKNEVIPAVSTCEMDPSFAAWLESVGIEYENYQQGDLSIFKQSEEDLLFDEIVSLKGLECFTSVKEFRIEGLPNVTEIDLSNIENIHTLIIMDLPNLEKLNVSGNKDIEELILWRLNKLEMLDLSSNTNLKQLDITEVFSLETVVQPNASSLEEVWVWGTKALKTINLDKQKHLSHLNLLLTDLEKVILTDLDVNHFDLSLDRVNGNVVDYSKFNRVSTIGMYVGDVQLAFIPDNFRSKINSFWDHSESLITGEVVESYTGKNTTTLTYLQTMNGYEIDIPTGMLIDRVLFSNPNFVKKDGKLVYQGNDFENDVKDVYYDYVVVDGTHDGENDSSLEEGYRDTEHRARKLRVYPTFVERTLDESGTPVVDNNKNTSSPNAATAPPTGDATNQTTFLLLGFGALLVMLKTRVNKYER